MQALEELLLKRLMALPGGIQQARKFRQIAKRVEKRIPHKVRVGKKAGFNTGAQRAYSGGAVTQGSITLGNLVSRLRVADSALLNLAFQLP